MQEGAHHGHMIVQSPLKRRELSGLRAEPNPVLVALVVGVKRLVLCQQAVYTLDYRFQTGQDGFQILSISAVLVIGRQLRALLDHVMQPAKDNVKAFQLTRYLGEITASVLPAVVSLDGDVDEGEHVTRGEAERHESDTLQ